MEWLNKLNEHLGDNAEAQELLKAGMAEIEKLNTSNAELAQQSQTWQKRFNEGVDVRQKLKEENEVFKAQLEGGNDSEKWQKQIDSIRSDYETKLSEATKSMQAMENDYISSMERSALAELGLANRLPEGIEETTKKAYLDIAYQELRNEGLAFDKESKSFIFKDGDVAKLNPNTGKPYTLQEMRDIKLESKGWGTMFKPSVVPNGGADRKGAESGAVEAKVMSRSNFNNLSPQQKADFSRNGGKLED